MIFVDVVLSNTDNEEREKCDCVRLISNRNMLMFRLVQILLKNNSYTYNIIVLCCERIGYPDELRAATYKLENRFINMISFQFDYNLKKRVSDWNS
jgi:hypothetical protein